MNGAPQYGPDGPCVSCWRWHPPGQHVRSADERKANRQFARRRGIPAAEWRRNTIESLLGMRRSDHRDACIAEEIRALLPRTEGQLTWALRGRFSGDDVARVLHTMVGKRFGRDCSGEVVVGCYSAGGGEVYALRTDVDGITERAVFARWRHIERAAATL